MFRDIVIGLTVLASAMSAAFGVQEASASESGFSASRSGGNVILVTIDGVRWEEMFRGEDGGLGGSPGRVVFESLWGELIQQGLIFGNRQNGGEVIADNPSMMSLPAYQTIMAGKVIPCFTNGCGRIDVETLPERLVKELGCSREDVAALGSWNRIENAVQHQPGSILSNHGMVPFLDGDPAHREINRRQKLDPPPWGGARHDKFTMAHALHYLKTRKPRFLYISLNDPDEWGHRNHYPNYLKSLREADQWLEDLVESLAKMGEYGRKTTVIVTTDHGRGRGRMWHAHSLIQSSRFIWLYATGPHVQGAGSGTGRPDLSHIDLRPTVEALFGLEPKECDGCGKPIPFLLPRSAGSPVSEPS